jgi:hypothetical protein
LGGQRTIAIAVGGIGVAGVVAGTILGVMANTKWQQAKTDCGTGCAPGTTAQDEASSAHSTATLANVVFAAGAVGLGTGAALWLLAPKPKAATAWHVAPFVANAGGGLVAAGSLP